MVLVNKFDFKKSITFKICVFIALIWALASIFPIDKTYLTGGIEEVWSGKFWLPLTDWVAIDSNLMRVATLLGLLFFGLQAEIRLGTKDFTVFIIVSHSISTLINLLMFLNLGGGLSGMIWALAVLYLIPRRSSLNKRLFTRTLTFFLTFHIFTYLLVGFSLSTQMAHLLQCMAGVSVGMLFLLIGRVSSHKTRIRVSSGIAIALWLVSFYNPFHYLYDVYLIQKVYNTDPTQGAQMVRTLLQNDSNESEAKGRAELAQRVLDNKYPEVDKSLALQALQKGDPKDLYTAIVLANFFSGDDENIDRNDTLALKYLNYLPENKIPDAVNAKALIYCGSNHSALKDVSKGYELSEKSNEFSEWSQPEYLSTYAICLSQKGNFSEAEKWIKRALLLTPSGDSTLTERLNSELFRLKEGRSLTYPLLDLNPLDSVESKSHFENIDSQLERS